MDTTSLTYITGHRGLVGSALSRRLLKARSVKLLTEEPGNLDLRRQADTERFFEAHKIDHIFLAAAIVEVKLTPETDVEPKLVVNRPIEDMSPHMPRKRLNEAMIIKPLPEPNEKF